MSQSRAKQFGERAGILGLIWLVTYFTARGALEIRSLPPWARLTAALVPLPVFAGFLITYLRALRAADELEQKIHSEALALAFWLATLLLTTLALMQRAVTLSFADWSYAHVWIYLPMFYFLGIAVVSRRYRDP